MSQELIFTVLPHQRIVRDGQNYLQLSVYVTIRLESASNGKLSDFEDILNWPDRILGNKYLFEFNNSALALPGELQKTRINSDLYKKLLYGDIRVNKFVQEDLTLKRINSFPLRHVKDFVLKNYTQAAIEDSINFVSADKFIDEERFGLFSPIKIDENELFRNENNRTKNLDKPQKTIVGRLPPNDIRFNLQKYRFIPGSKQSNPVLDISQFRNFHKLDLSLIHI